MATKGVRLSTSRLGKTGMYSNRYSGMLNQVNHWMEYASAGVDVLLFLRVLALRLQRTYIFLTLICVLAVVFDAVIISLTRGSPERERVEIYSSLLLAFVFPLAAWDVFEEVGNPLAAIRRAAILRTFTSLLMITFFAIILAIPAFSIDDPTNLEFVLRLTLVVSTGSATGCLTFLWTMRRTVRLQKLALPSNTSVWMIFYALFLGAQIVTWFVSLLEVYLGQTSNSSFPQITELVFTLYGMAITVWCAVKLRALPKDLPSASLNENS